MDPPAHLPFASADPPSSRSGRRVPSWIAPRRSVVEEGVFSGARPKEHDLAGPPSKERETREAASPVASREPPVAAPEPPLPEPLPTPTPDTALIEENRILREGLTRMAAELASSRHEIIVASESEVARLALLLAERIVARELRTDPKLVLTWAKEGLRSLAEGDEVSLAISRDLGSVLVLEEAALTLGDRCRLEVDEALPPATCELRSRFARLDLSVSAHIRALAEALELEAP